MIGRVLLGGVPHLGRSINPSLLRPISTTPSLMHKNKVVQACDFAKEKERVAEKFKRAGGVIYDKGLLVSCVLKEQCVATFTKMPGIANPMSMNLNVRRGGYVSGCPTGEEWLKFGIGRYNPRYIWGVWESPKDGPSDNFTHVYKYLSTNRVTLDDREIDKLLEVLRSTWTSRKLMSLGFDPNFFSLSTTDNVYLRITLNRDGSTNILPSSNYHPKNFDQTTQVHAYYRKVSES